MSDLPEIDPAGPNPPMTPEPAGPSPAPSPEIQPANVPEEAPLSPAIPDDGRPYDDMRDLG